MTFRNLKSEQTSRRSYPFLNSLAAFVKTLSYDFQSFSLPADETGDSKALSLFFIASPRQHCFMPQLFARSVLRQQNVTLHELRWTNSLDEHSPNSPAHLTNQSCKSTTQTQLLNRLERSSTDSNEFVWGNFLLHIKTYGNP